VLRRGGREEGRRFLAVISWDVIPPRRLALLWQRQIKSNRITARG